MIKLYYRPGSCAMAVHLTLEILGVDYEAVPVSDELLESEEYKKINPRNQVPSLETEHGLMTESVAMMVYLTNKYGGDLTPAKDSWEYGQMLMMMMFMASQEHPAFGIRMRPWRWTDEESAHAGISTKAEQNWLTCLGRTEGWAAAGNGWMVGDKMTVADCLAWVHGRWGLRTEPKTPDGFPNLWAVTQRVDALPVTRKVLEMEGLTPLA